MRGFGRYRCKGVAVRREVTAGCHGCSPAGEALWSGGQAQGTAAQHAYRTGHRTWVEVSMRIAYNEPLQRQSEGLFGLPEAIAKRPKRSVKGRSGSVHKKTKGRKGQK